ncbi:unnamed protein product [Calicophoron daubneyi]|uniref:NR LBD domain-containing protein n=1 Tax=Calicophoron daubneyi TaxID=300641 RepID=A0AAV2TE26_CALDB
MYPVVMLLLSRDYQPETDEYNYFDFTPEERTVIMHHFSTYIRFTEHLRMAGRLLHHLGLTLPELSLWCAVEILRNYQLLDEPTRSNTKELFILAHYSLKAYMTRRTDTTTESSEQHRWTQMVALSKMMQAMNREHHDILSTLKELRPDLHFPELYIEMFQLADSASALFSASAKAVTLACSSAFQPLAPLKLSLCTTPTELGSSASSDMLYSQSGESTTAEVSTVNSSHAFLPTNDRWDAGRLALAVPAAVAAIAAVSAEASALSQDVQHRQQQQQHIQHQPQLALPSPDSTVQRPTSIIVNSSTTNPNSSYFTAPSSFFFPTSQSQQQQQ